MATAVEVQRAGLAVAELEEELSAAKTGDTDSADYLELKAKLRAARRYHRQLRAGDPVAPGDAVASPDPITATAEVQS